jgi:hypothetical protein
LKVSIPRKSSSCKEGAQMSGIRDAGPAIRGADETPDMTPTRAHLELVLLDDSAHCTIDDHDALHSIHTIPGHTPS